MENKTGKTKSSKIGHLAMVPAKASFQMHVGRSSTLYGQPGQYGEKYEPQIKCSECPELYAGLIPRTSPWTGVHQ